jgi:protein SEY1
MCRAQMAPLLVMDVEGMDGRERGEDQEFQRKSAVFSLASSEVSTTSSLSSINFAARY